MSRFLGEGNVCGQTILRIAARGSSIMAELFRLADNVPPVFAGGNDPDVAKYAPVLFDFAYLRNPEEHERRVNDNTELLDADDELQESYEEILGRFYRLFESMCKYHEDLCSFLEQLTDGLFIEYTVDSVLLDTDGKQLLCEAFYNLGLMLLVLDIKIPGPARERMVVAYFRARGESNLTSIDDVCKLARATGFTRGMELKKRPQHYPEAFFERFELPEEVVRMVIGVLRSDDVYLQTRSFPAPQHRSTRLANQASLLYVILFFVPDILHDETATMREIVDKHFNENYILSLYMGHVVDLSAEWGRYPAARAALGNSTALDNLSQTARRNDQWINEALAELDGYLTEGVLTELYLLDNLHPLLNCLRKANVALRWRLLHRRSGMRKLQEVLAQGASPEKLMQLLLLTAQLEWRLKSMFEATLEAKETKWEACKGEAAGRMVELGEYFSGEKALTRVDRDEHLMGWFNEMGEQIRALDYSDATVAGRRIQQLVHALEEVEQFEQIDTSLQIKQFLADSRDYLMQMIRTVNVKDEVLDILDNVSDLSYAWELLNDYVGVLHERVRQDPQTVVLLRALFLKLASILDVPLIRISQCDSPDTISVAEFYSSELVSFLRKVMEVIPKSVFRILTQIVELQLSSLQLIPVKLETQYLKDYALLPHRYELARLTHRVSVFTEGILAMEKTLLGIIQVDPRQILEDGMRTELVRQIAHAMHANLVFPRGTATEFEAVLNELCGKMSGLRRSIEYIQDYVNMAGLRIFQEEMFRIINYGVEQETNRFLKKKVLDQNSQYQSRAIPIPRFAPLQGDSSYNFIGRLKTALMRLTDPAGSIYAPECTGWYEPNGTEVCGLSSFSLLNRTVGVLGLAGLDRLLSFSISNDLTSFVRFYGNHVTGYLPLLEQLTQALTPECAIPANPDKLYSSAMKKTVKLMNPLLQTVQRVGQCQLLRKQIANELSFCCRLDANLLSIALDTLNKSVLTDIKAHYADPDTHPYPPEGCALLVELARFLDTAGLDDPLSKVYITSDPLSGLPALLMLLVVTYMPKLEYDAQFGTLVRKRDRDPVDGAPFIVGVACLLKQFHPSYTRHFLAFLGQYVRASIGIVLGGRRVTALPLQVVNTLIFIELFCRFSKIPRAVTEGFVPDYVLDAVKLAPVSS